MRRHRYNGSTQNTSTGKTLINLYPFVTVNETAIGRGGVRKLSDDDRRMLLSEQIEEHRRLREQAHRVIRMLLAAAGIPLTIIAYKIYPDLSIASQQLTAAGGGLRVTGLVQSTAENSLIVAGFFVSLSLGLLFMSVMNAIGAIVGEGTLPLSRHKPALPDGAFDTADGPVQWILTNDERLVETERNVQQSYHHIHAAIGSALVVLLLIFGIVAASLEFLAFVHISLLLLVPALGLHYSRDALAEFYEGVRSDGVRSALERAGDAFADSMHHRGVSGNIKVAGILFYGMYYPYSRTIVEVWLMLFVL